MGEIWNEGNVRIVLPLAILAAYKPVKWVYAHSCGSVAVQTEYCNLPASYATEKHGIYS